ncbi:ROK family protein [Sphingobium sp.]|uniref:ROK family protein n=1 Tax=Sphingobium sp. TaxID=1912891 RepID=UPI0029C04692|nr:ROK family protein [Sphingobium sp.]
MAMTPSVAGIELGGTKAIAVLAEGARIIRRQVVPTTSPAETLEALASTLGAWDAQTSLQAIGIASFGPVRLDRAEPDFGHMLDTPKSGWRGVDLISSLAVPFGRPFALDTDVNGAALAEYAWGAGVGCDSLCYITIGTGVGAGLVIDGRPVHGALHPEIGHMMPRRTATGDFAGICPFHCDCIEGLVSGPALEARFGKPGVDVEKDNPLWLEIAGEIAQMVVNVLLTTAARRVLIGGGVGMGQPQLLPLIQSKIVALLGGYLQYVNERSIADIVQHPALGADAGPLGAVALALAALKESPEAASFEVPGV